MAVKLNKADLTKNQRLREIFSGVAAVTLTTWNLPSYHGLILKSDMILHILSGLKFTKSHPKQDTGSAAVQDSSGAVDVKTSRECVSTFIHCLKLLEQCVVRENLYCTLALSCLKVTFQSEEHNIQYDTSTIIF